MATIKQLQQAMERGFSLKMVSEAYSELSAAKLKRIRTSIENNTNFASEISYIFQLVKWEAASREIVDPIKKDGSVHILITSNYQFYGSIERPLIQYYLKFIDNPLKKKPTGPVTRLVIGQTGQSYLKSVNYQNPFKNMTFQSDLPTATEIQSLTSEIQNYKTILVYHTSFKSVLSQVSTISDISQSVNNTTHTPEQVKTHIYEPEMDKILQFFNTQIVQLLIEQTFLEAELARTAARLITMDQAQLNANSFISDQKKQLLIQKRAVVNSNLLYSIGALEALRKGVYGNR